jgi:hypothetical protein
VSILDLYTQRLADTRPHALMTVVSAAVLGVIVWWQIVRGEAIWGNKYSVRWIHRDENPWSFWAIVGSMAVLSLFCLTLGLRGCFLRM